VARATIHSRKYHRSHQCLEHTWTISRTNCERLAAFITITSTDGVDSAIRFLEIHDFTHIDAVSAWSVKGRLPFIHSEGSSHELRQMIVSDHFFRIINGMEQPTDLSSAIPDSEEAVP
jgi:hypothetical protein